MLSKELAKKHLASHICRELYKHGQLTEEHILPNKRNGKLNKISDEREEAEESEDEDVWKLNCVLQSVTNIVQLTSLDLKTLPYMQVGLLRNVLHFSIKFNLGKRRSNLYNFGQLFSSQKLFNKFQNKSKAN